MTLRTRDELRRELGNGQIANLYLLYGAEDYLRDRAARAITEAALKDASLREFNESSFSLLHTDVQAAIAAAEQLPMMASRRVVRVTDFSKIKEADEEILQRYLVAPASSATVIFVTDDLDKRKRLSRTLLDVCTAVEFPELAGAELTAWARSALKELKASADERTLNRIVSLVGANARTLYAELSKLAVAALPSNEIKLKDVEQLTGRTRELSNFELADHLINSDREQALRTLETLFEDKAEPLMLLGLIASQFRRLLLTKELMAEGKPQTEVFRIVGLPFNKRENFLATARRSSVERLARGIKRIAETDLAIKTSLGGGGDKGARLQLEMLICELTQ